MNLGDLFSQLQVVPKWLWGFFAFAYGAIIGSFNNVLIYRLPREMSIVFPPSHCPVCKRKLKPWHNIPIVSYIILRGRCYYCKAPIPIRYLIVEVLTALSFLFCFLKFGFSLDTLRWMAFFGIAIPITFIDWEWQIIPDELNIALGIVGLIFATLYSVLSSSLTPLLEALLTAFLFSGLFISIYFIGKLIFKKEALGLGDVKLAFALGLFLAKPHLVFLTTFISFTVGAIYGISAYLIKNMLKPRFKVDIPVERWSLGLLAIPLFGGILREFLIYEEDVRHSFYLAFGPFMLLGALLAGLYGDTIIKWYLDNILGLYPY